MRTRTKVWLIIAACLVLIGCLLFVGVMTMFNWDFTKLSTVRFELNEHEISENFSNISVDTDTAEIVFLLSDDEKCRVECYEESKAKHSVTVENDTLIIKTVNKKAWYDHIGISFGSPKISVYLPKAQYSALNIKESTGDIKIPSDFEFESADITLSTGNIDFSSSVSELIKIKTSTGDIFAQNITAGALDLSASTGRITVSNVECKEDIRLKVSTGKTTLSNIKCRNLISNGSTGSISLDSVIATEKFSIKRSTGDVSFDSADASEIFIETDTGDVLGSLLNSKIFLTQTDTGRISVPNSASGGKCEIKTDTGDIKITVK